MLFNMCLFQFPTKSVQLLCSSLYGQLTLSDEDLHIYLTDGSEVTTTTLEVDVRVSPVIRLYDLTRYATGVITDARIAVNNTICSYSVYEW
jgi:hypothetical protein